MTPVYVLDSGALMAYVHGVEAVGQALVDAADANEIVAVPSVCLLEAYSRLTFGAEFDTLALLRVQSAIRVVEPGQWDPDDLPFIGGMAGRSAPPRLGVGHAAYVAMASAAVVYTSRPDDYWAILGEQWPIVEV